MADAPNDSENQTPETDQLKATQDSSSFDASKPNTLRSLSLPKISLPKIGLPKVNLQKPKSPFKKINFFWFWLVIILISHICVGYFLSVLLTMPSRDTLAIAGFVIFGLLPTITAFADYALMKWIYLVSGFLIVGYLVFLVKLKFYLIVLAIIVWVGLTAIAFVGDFLIAKQNRNLWMAIGILTIPCLIGLGLGYQIWRLATLWS